MAEKKQRAAAICDNCGSVHAVRLRADGEIRPLGTGNGTDCTCEDSDLRIMDHDTTIPDGEDAKGT